MVKKTTKKKRKTSLKDKKPKKIGKPRIFEDSELPAMQKKIDEYFNVECAIKHVPLLDLANNPIYDKKGNPMYITKEHPPTVAGLSLYLGFTNRKSFYDYIHNFPAYSDTLKKAISKIEDYAEQSLLSGRNPAGAIFWLKNKHCGAIWCDKTESENETKVVVQMPMVEIGGKPIKFNVGREKK